MVSLGLAIFVGVIVGSAAWDELLAHDPFSPETPVPPPPAPPPPPALELRGVLVEGGVTWFNVYNGETKESAWVKKGEQLTAFVVKDYDMAKDALTLESPHRVVSVALKQSKMQLLPGSARRASAVASLPPFTARPTTVALAAPMPASETQRLAQVAGEIRERREQRKRRAVQNSS